MDKKGANCNQTYDFIIESFSEERIKSRYEWIYSLMIDYIEFDNLQNQAYISEDILNHVVIDYFVDIYRLKEFQNIETTHDSKIYAYLIYWILRHKPIQICGENAEKLAFINEMFCTELLRRYLFDNPKNVSIANSHKEVMDNFWDTLFYYFKYREYSAKSIEMVILAFGAGRAYQLSADK